MTAFRSHAILGVKWTGGATGFGLALQLLQMAVLARYLSIEAFGLFGESMVIVGIAYPEKEGGIPIIWIEYEDVRDRYLPGDQLPDNTVLDSVERVAPGEYIVKRSRAGKPEDEIRFVGDKL